MKKALRTAVKLAEVEGLKVLAVNKNTKHYSLVVKNKFGWRMTHPLALGDLTDRDRNNTRAELRRFARGQYHGLRVVEDKNENQ